MIVECQKCHRRWESPLQIEPCPFCHVSNKLAKAVTRAQQAKAEAGRLREVVEAAMAILRPSGLLKSLEGERVERLYMGSITKGDGANVYTVMESMRKRLAVYAEKEERLRKLNRFTPRAAGFSTAVMEKDDQGVFVRYDAITGVIGYCPEE